MNGQSEMVVNITWIREAPKRHFMVQSHYPTGQVESLLFVDKTRVDF